MSDCDDEDDDKAEAVIVQYGADAHDGPGWYYYERDYPDEGSVGAFATYEDALEFAMAADMFVREPST